MREKAPRVPDARSTIKAVSMNRRRMLVESLKWGSLATVALSSIPTEIFALENGAEIGLTGNPLRFPPVFTNGGILDLAETNVEVWPGTLTQVISINGSYPGPTVRIQRGETFSATLQNQLGEPATAHWHGLIAPETMDGHPKDPVAPGASYLYTFPVVQRAGTYFYHAHAHQLTAKHVYRGFAGLFIVDDDNETSLGLPRGDFDVPLVIQDRRSADQPAFVYSPTMMDATNGYLGDTVLVNGTPDPYLEVSRTLYRFRLVNGSNARVYRIAFADNHQFQIVATDSGLKDEAVAATSFYLSPGERVDILVDFSSYALAGSVILKSLPFPGGGGSQGTELNLIRFDVTGTLSSGGSVPSSMPPIVYHDPLDVVRTRTFDLSMTMGSANIHRINNLTYDIDRIDEEVPQGDLEEWRITNGTGLFHPIHIHGIMFQVFSRNSNTSLPPADWGWKDTVLVYPSEVVSILVRFTDYTGIYLLHCHNLEHEDDGMMLNFRVNGTTDVQNETPSLPSEFRLHQNYPNPFNPSTVIDLDIPLPSHVRVDIFDITGTCVSTLADGMMQTGHHSLIYSPIATDGSFLPSGPYIVRMTAGTLIQTIKITLLR
jgi:FtsP/CotA-like multicopper oxidase with cupredoxin domain